MRAGWGMDWTLALIILVFLEGLIILKGLTELSRQINEGLDDLDTTLAEAIQAVISNVGIGEPINPIQSALAQILVNSVNKESPAATILEQGADGKFVSKE